MDLLNLAPKKAAVCLERLTASVCVLSERVKYLCLGPFKVLTLLRRAISPVYSYLNQALRQKELSAFEKLLFLFK